MNETPLSRPEVPLGQTAEDQSPQLSKPDSPGQDANSAITPPLPPTSPSGFSTLPRFTMITLAFLVHIVAWAGFWALKVASESYYRPGQEFVTLAMLVLALLAGASVIAIARYLSPIPRSVITLISVVIFGISGLAEVAIRTLPEPVAIAMGVVAQPLPYIGLMVFPFVLVALVVILLSRPDDAEAANQSEKRIAPGIILLTTSMIMVLSVLIVTNLQFGEVILSWFDMGWPLAVLAIIGTVTVLFILEQLPRNSDQNGATGVTWFTVARGAAYVVMVSGMHLCFMATVVVVYADAAGIGGMLLGMVALPCYLIASIIVVICAYAPRRPTVPDAS